MSIHPSSIVDPKAELAKDVVVGPFCVIHGKVQIDSGTVLESHVSIGNDTGIIEIGKNNRICAGAIVGGPPQDLKYKGEPTKLVIGHGNTIREMATLNTGTPTGGGVTKVGDNNLIMAYVHVAHDCVLGSHIAIANSSQLAGHVTIEDFVRIGGMCGFNQFVRVGKYSFVAGDASVSKDVLPFSIAQGNYAMVRAANKIGMERGGFAKEDIEGVTRAIRIVTKGSDTIEGALARILEECPKTESLEYLIRFIKSSERGIAI